MCALIHLISSRDYARIIDKYESGKIEAYEHKQRIQRRALRTKQLMGTRKGRIQLMFEKLQRNGQCSICGKLCTTTNLFYIPPNEALKYIEYLVDNKILPDIKCCGCTTDWANRHMINITDFIGFAPHDNYWLNYCPQSLCDTPPLVLPEPPSRKITRALENMFYLPEGAETFLDAPDLGHASVITASPIEIEVNGDQFIMVNTRRRGTII